MSTTPTPPPPPATPVEWREVLTFLQTQMTADREYFDHIFRRTLWALGIITTVCASALIFFGINTLSSINKTLAEVREDVRARVDSEFKKDNIEHLVKDIAEQKTKSAFAEVIGKEVATQIRTLQPGISSAVSHDLQERLKRFETFERHQAPRVLSSVQRLELIKALTAYAGYRIRVTQLIEKEPHLYAAQLISGLREAGWVVEITPVRRIVQEPIYGIYCGGPDIDHPAFKALVSVLERFGNPVTVQPSNDQLSWMTVALKSDD